MGSSSVQLFNAEGHLTEDGMLALVEGDKYFSLAQMDRFRKHTKECKSCQQRWEDFCFKWCS